MMQRLDDAAPEGHVVWGRADLCLRSLLPGGRCH